MHCMKCGRETESEQVFCQDCQLEMEKYPVKPGTVVQLPKQQDPAPKKCGNRRVIPLEDQVKILRKRVKVLTALLVIAVGLIAALAVPTVLYFEEEHFLPGQNYSSITVTTASEDTVEETAN